MTEEKRAHARLSPSGAHRWLTCSASVALEDGLPDTGSTYSREGTCAHTVAAMCLRDKQDPAAFLGRIFTVEGQDFECDHEMVGALRTYVNGVNARVKHYQSLGCTVQLHVEQEVPVGHVTDEEGATGTSDAIIIAVYPSGSATIECWDLKYGRGVYVSAEKNPQEMLYALGAVRKFELMADFTWVVLVISQPRISDVPSEYELGMDELNAFAIRRITAGNCAMLLLETKDAWLSAPDVAANPAFAPSDDACKFCKAKAICPALAKKTQDEIGVTFEDLATRTIKVGEAAHTINMDNTALGLKRAALDLIEDWCNAIRAKVNEELTAGRDVPGWKLVAGKKGNRQWEDDKKAEEALKSFRLPADTIYTKKIITPPAAEKVFKTDHPKRWAKLLPLIVQATGANTVAPASDPRIAITVKPVEETFDDLTAEQRAFVGDVVVASVDDLL